MVSFFFLSIGLLIFLFAMSYTLVRYVRNRKHPQQEQGVDLSSLIETLPPLFFELIPMKGNVWLQKEQLEQDSEVLKQAGFIHEHDCLSFQGGQQLNLSFWRHAKNPIGVVISETSKTDMPQVAASYQQQILLAGSGQCFTLTNSMTLALIPRPTPLPLALQSGKNLKQLLAAFKTTIPQGFKPARLNSTEALYQACCEQHALWLYQPEQLTGGKLGSLFESLKMTLNAELLEQLVEFGQEQRGEFYSQKILKQLAARSKMSAQQWQTVSSKLVVIHQQMSRQHVVDAFYHLFNAEQLLELEALQQQWPADLAPLKPIELFEQLIKRLKLNVGKCVAQLQQPVVAKVYQRR